MAGMTSIGVKFKYKTSSSGSYTELPNLQSTPAVGGTSSKVDVTTLADTIEKFVQGIKTLKDMAFTFLYDLDQTTSSYRLLQAVEASGNFAYFEVEYPDGSKFDFTGFVSLAINESKVNGALTFTATIITNSDITPTLASVSL